MSSSSSSCLVQSSVHLGLLHNPPLILLIVDLYSPTLDALPPYVIQHFLGHPCFFLLKVLCASDKLIKKYIEHNLLFRAFYKYLFTVCFNLSRTSNIISHDSIVLADIFAFSNHCTDQINAWCEWEGWVLGDVPCVYMSAGATCRVFELSISIFKYLRINCKKFIYEGDCVLFDYESFGQAPVCLCTGCLPS